MPGDAAQQAARTVYASPRQLRMNEVATTKIMKNASVISRHQKEAALHRMPLRPPG